ncbi:DNA-binding protein [Pseudomonas sp. 681]|uniref:DNA-binding protein n=1 Tax=Pseudomonas fungipugnans TaxID=3024217 RepID=A0ABT6QUE0_9PSED|nr:DNA-binding protein [Pseudomonas sp. 681]MDI2594351.1 DNA-binding protein [Pseudomonas sp. 681]
MTLLLDGHKVQGKNLKVTANLRIESGDMSGQTSNTDKAHKGFKPKTLTVSLMIPFVDRTQMTDLMRLAESTAGGGQLHLYRVVNDTAAAFGVRQVEFSEGISAREDDSLRAWLVQFTLSERESNPEKVEGRRAGNKVNAQGGPGSAVGEGGDGSGSGGGSTGDPALSGFEKVLGRVDKWLGGSEQS